MLKSDDEYSPRTTIVALLLGLLFLFKPNIVYIKTYERYMWGPPCTGYGHFSNGTCHCYPCRSGDFCEVHGSDCVVDVSGVPTLLEQYWYMKDQAAVSLPPHIGINASFTAAHSIVESLIRRIHLEANNVVFDKRTRIVFATSFSQLLSAATFALTNSSMVKHSNYNSAHICFHRLPFRATAGETEKLETEYEKDGTQLRRVAMVPDELGMDTHILNISSGIVDRTQFWPHFVHIKRPVHHGEKAVSLFSLSRVTGHAHFSWAVVGSSAVAEKMKELMIESDTQVSFEALWRLQFMLRQFSDSAENFFGTFRHILIRRWSQLEGIFMNCTSWKLLKTDFFGPFAWLESTHASGAAETLKKHRILARSGTAFGQNKSWARVALLVRELDFSILEIRLRTMCELLNEYRVTA